MSTTITVVGSIATDPKLIRPSSGVQLCSFRIASDERRFDREQQGWVEGHTNWFGVVAFRGLANHAHESFKKGDRVIVTGRLRVRKWEKDEKRGTSVEIEADSIGHDVRFGVTQFEKRVFAQTSEREQADSPETTPTHSPHDSAHQISEDAFTPRVAA